VVRLFTGLVADLGTVTAVDASDDGGRLTVQTGLELREGDSVAVNGVCLTATSLPDGAFTADVMNETLRRSSLGALEQGSRVNLELPLRADDRLGGHFVQGHVDGTGEVTKADDDGFARRLRVALDPGLAGQVVERGSIALDGVSLTVSGIGDDWLEVSLIPETLQRTNLGEASPGRTLNVECDVIGKYVQRLMAPLKDGERPQSDG
jgi:riboflavin synthase